MPFSQRLREATAVQHEQAETSGFMNALTSGHLDVHAYAALAAQLWFVYDALETTGEHLQDDATVGAFVDDRLHRREVLRQDLAYLLGYDWDSRVEPLGATQAYADQIRSTLDRPPAYLGHHYTRYLGDLSGGQILARVLTRTYGMTDGLRFFTFDEIPKPKPYKDAYRARLDALALDDAGQQRVVQEAQRAFDLNTDLFAALGGLHLPRVS